MAYLQALPLGQPGVFLLMAALIAVSAFLQGVGGVGFTMFAAPIAVMVSPELVPGPLLTLGCLIALLSTVRERQHILWGQASFGLVGRVLGAIAAVAVLSHISGRQMNLLFAGLIVLAVLLSASGMKVMASRRNLGVAGLFSGIMSTLTSVGAPPLAIAMQYGSPPVVRATLGAILTGGAFSSVVALGATGHYHPQEGLLAATLFPFMMLGFWLSNRARHRVSSVMLRRWLLVFCTLSAIALVLKTILEWG